MAGAWARRLRAEGARPGDRVAVREPAGVRFAALLHGCLRAGVAMVPLPARGFPEPYVEALLEDCRPRLLVRDGEVEARAGSRRGDEGDLCVLYTSGTTGPPKGVRLTLANHLASALGCQESLGSGPGDRWLLALSPHHVGGLAVLLRSAICNQPVIALERFRERDVLEAIASDRPTLVSLVPTMLHRLLAAGGAEPLRQLRAILVGGAPAPEPWVRQWAAAGLAVCPSYGLTETCSQVAVVPPGRAAELAGSAGLVHSGARVRLEGGEIVVSGAVVSPGYVDAALTPAPRGGSFRTGDLGRLDASGALWVTGRRDDAIWTAGENVQPEEVEAVLRAHPGVADAALRGVPDETWGQVLEAMVVAGGLAPTPEELSAWCRERLPAFKVPRRIRYVRELPRSEGGKLLRRELR